MDKQILENSFETIYKEYLNYKNYFKSIEKSPEDRRKDVIEKVTSGELSDEQAIDFMFDNGIKYEAHKKDLEILGNKLFIAFYLLNGVLEFPKEVLDEVKSLKEIQAGFFIENGEAVMLNKSAFDEIKNQLKLNFNQTKEYLKSQKSE